MGVVALTRVRLGIRDRRVAIVHAVKFQEVVCKELYTSGVTAKHCCGQLVAMGLGLVEVGKSKRESERG